MIGTWIWDERNKEKKKLKKKQIKITDKNSDIKWFQKYDNEMNKTDSHSHVITGKFCVSLEKVSSFLNEGRKKRKEGKNQESRNRMNEIFYQKNI